MKMWLQHDGGSNYTVAVHFYQGKNLLAKDSNGYSDPYLKLFLNPKKSKAKKGV